MKEIKDYNQQFTRNEYNFGSGDRLSLNFSNKPSIIRDVYPTGFHNLPVQVLLKIFKYFDEKELRKNLMPVSK